MSETKREQERINEALEMYAGTRPTCQAFLEQVVMVHCDDWPGTCIEWCMIVNLCIYFAHANDPEFWKSR